MDPVHIQCTQIKTDLLPEQIDEEFINISTRLSKVKSYFDGMSSFDFNRTMQQADRYFYLKKIIKSEYNMKVSTNASLKMYEMMALFNLVPPGEPINVFCNAELPGAFISAINHYAVNVQSKLNWVASSYWPGDSGATSSILEDIYGIYTHNKERWLMGRRPDGSYVSGDVRSFSVISELAKSAELILGVKPNLYTSDAGIDVSSDYNKQEELTISLNYGQILCGLLSLNIGGNLVTKQYTFFTKFNRALIYKLSLLFDKVCITKPMTSRPANSEVYIVGYGFKGIPEDMMLELKEISNILEADGTAYDKCLPILGTVPVEFDAHLLQISDIIYNKLQIKKLEAIRAGTDGKGDYASKWIAKTKIKPILNKFALNSNNSAYGPK